MNSIFSNIEIKNSILLGISRMESMGRRFRGSGSSTTENILLYSLMIIALCIIFGYVANWLIQRSKTISTLRLFYGLCRANNLDWKESFLLWQVASKLPLRVKPGIFLRPDLLVNATLQTKNYLNQQRLDAISAKLFNATVPNEQNLDVNENSRKENNSSDRPRTKTIREAMEHAEKEPKSTDNELVAANTLPSQKQHKNSTNENLIIGEFSPTDLTEDKLSQLNNKQNSISFAVKMGNKNLSKKESSSEETL